MFQKEENLLAFCETLVCFVVDTLCAAIGLGVAGWVIASLVLATAK